MDHHLDHDPQSWPAMTTDPTVADDANAKQPDETEGHGGHGRHGGHGGHGGHGLMMLVCCIPMILFAVGLVATGVADSGAIVVALLCTAMMAVMMLAMPGSHGHR